MSKMLVVAFDDETKAYEGARALRELHREGSVSVYAAAVVARDAAGRVSVKEEVDEGPIGTALGMMTGALVGLLAGPAGAAIGATAGGLLGATGDLINLGVGVDFVDEVGARLAPGNVAVVAEMEENWVTPVDSRMEALGGTVYRRWRADVEDEQIERDVAYLKADFEDLKAEYKVASEENKAKLEAKIDESRAKLEAAGDRAKAKLEATKLETEAKAKALEDQFDRAKARTKETLEKRRAELESDYETRRAKLEQAWELTKEAMAFRARD